MYLVAALDNLGHNLKELVAEPPLAGFYILYFGESKSHRRWSNDLPVAELVAL
jgi:hypothetical protein